MHTSADQNTSHDILPIHTRVSIIHPAAHNNIHNKKRPLLLSHTPRLTDPWCATKFIFPPQIDTLIYSIWLCDCLNLDLGCKGVGVERGRGGSKWSHFIALFRFNNGPVISDRRPYSVQREAQPPLWCWRKHQDGLHGCRRVCSREGGGGGGGGDLLGERHKLNIQTCEYGRWLAAAEAATRGIKLLGDWSVVTVPTWMQTVGGKWMAWQGPNAQYMH